MDLVVGSIVKSKAGRDKGHFFLVTAMEADCVFLVDGKIRPLARPKKKKQKHISPTKAVLPLEKITHNKAVKNLLRDFCQSENENT